MSIQHAPAGLLHDHTLPLTKLTILYNPFFRQLRLPLKLSRFRLVAKVLVILAVSQVDLVTDLLMLVEYSRQADREGAFVASACIMGLGWLAHIGMAFWSNTGRSASAVAREVLIAATFVAPVVGTYRFVVGAELDENSTANMTPLLMYVFVKGIELIFESIPESILQASVLLQSEAGDGAMSTLSVVSFAASLLAAGLLVADLNHTMENDNMKAQQTPGVHPLYGFLRTSARGQAAFFLSSWAFLSAYLACTVLAFGCLLVTQPWWVFFGLATVEVLAFAAFKAAQGEFTQAMNHTNNPVIDWGCLIAYHTLASSVPIFQLRVRPWVPCAPASLPHYPRCAHDVPSHSLPKTCHPAPFGVWAPRLQRVHRLPPRGEHGHRIPHGSLV